MQGIFSAAVMPPSCRRQQSSNHSGLLSQSLIYLTSVLKGFLPKNFNLTSSTYSIQISDNQLRTEMLLVCFNAPEELFDRSDVAAMGFDVTNGLRLSLPACSRP